MPFTEFLSYLERYVELTDEDKQNLIPFLHSRTYLKGQYIVQAGDVCRAHTFIQSGLVRTFYMDEGGTEHILMFGIENWWAGDLGSTITGEEADFHVHCIEDTKVVQIRVEDMERLYEEIPAMERMFRLLMQNALVSAQRRIVNTYSHSASERYQQFCKKYPEMVHRLPQYMIASYLGITKEFLSTIRRKLAQES